jgi:DNA-binding transcriptional ArsR family regulator
MKQLACETDTCEQLCEHPQDICLTKAEMITEDCAKGTAELFKILGDPTRIKILHALSRREHCVCDLAAIVAMGQSAVSHQLRLLRGAHVVKYRKEGKLVWYSLDDKHIFSLLSQGIEHVNHR